MKTHILVILRSTLTIIQYIFRENHILPTTKNHAIDLLPEKYRATGVSFDTPVAIMKLQLANSESRSHLHHIHHRRRHRHRDVVGLHEDELDLP